MKTFTFLLVSLFLCITMFLGTIHAQSTMMGSYYLNDFSGNAINDINCSITSSKAMQQLNNELIVTADGFNAKGQAVLIIEFTNAIDMSNNSLLNLEVQARDLVMADGTTTSIRIFPSLYDVNGNKTGGDSFDYIFNATISNAAGWVSKQLNMATYPSAVDFTKIKKLRLNYQTNAIVTSGSIVLRKVELGIRPIINDVNCSITSSKEMQQLNNEMIVTADGFSSKGQAVLNIEFANALDMSNNSVLNLEVLARNLVMADGTTTSIRIFPRLYDVNGNYTGGDSYDWQFNATISNAAGWVIKQLDMATYAGTVDFTKIKKLRLNYQTNATVTSGSIVFRKVELGLRPIFWGSLSINWNNIVGQLTSDHWGINGQAMATGNVDTSMINFVQKVQPGVIRLHNSGLVNSLVNDSRHEWDEVAIENMLSNTVSAIENGSRIMLTLDDCPDFISSTLPLTETQEDSLAVFFAQLPVIIKQLGYHVDLYEFLNEKEDSYVNNYVAYWRMLNKIAVAMKTADSTVKCGGPAMSYATSSIYKGFIDNCKNNMDFISLHSYARGAGSNGASVDDLITGNHAYRNQASTVGAVASYLKSNNITNLECFVDEFNIQYVWTPYEPLMHNYQGASWMACLVKSVAMQGITGMNIWNADDNGAYGLNYTSAGVKFGSAPANLYLMSKYLRGNLVESSDQTDKVEMIPIISADGSKSVLFVNRTDTMLTIFGAKQLIGGDTTLINGLRLDGTTQGIGDVNIAVEMDSIPTDVILNPYGMLLLTNSTTQDLLLNNNGIQTVKTSDIPTVNNFSLSIYPNPVTNILYIKTNFENADISIYNNIGELMIKDKNKDKLNVSKLKSGIYVLQIRSESQYYNSTFVKISDQ